MTCVYGSDAVENQTWLSMQLGRHANAQLEHYPLGKLKIAIYQPSCFSVAAASDACVIAIIQANK